MNRILLQRDEVAADGTALLQDSRATHVLRVLRARPGDSLRVGLIDGPRGEGVVESAETGRVRLRCRFEPAPPPEPQVDLLLALPRPKVLKRLWAPLASMGVGRVIVTNAAKVERSYFDTHWLSPEHYVPRLIEGLQQSGDTRLPRVEIRKRLKPFVEDELDALFPGHLRLTAHPRDAQPLSAMRPPSPRRVLLALGPEGGWTDFELSLLEEHDFVRAGMGWRTLRSDIACIAMLAVVSEWTRESCEES